MIRTIIFDIGNVLAGFVWREHYESLGYSEEVIQRLGKATVGSPAWEEYDRGALSDEEVLQEFIRNDPGIEKELREALRDVRGMVARYDYALPWIKELKQQGYRVLVLSNFGKKAYEDCREDLDFLDYVDGGILSYQERIIKPEPEIYRLLLERYSLKPEECVFLDDLKVNLEAASAFGIHTIHFRSREQALEELERLGVGSPK